ncbi:hypothetical protein RUMHYD_01234 [Blautia hydrogenotrophica DSM 10507]|uniref:Uncharacterized protein n=1 Tax=Blautia hydrogenotrophica (strain DSM 10507 / JCM 14656 / S5a33) TaxID=476272 RepID=C0CK65_BLAHS|nr:hypothetical protein RUMHYD_01234 [Blautia hydrogenotrophica DSM 10507]
MPFYIPPIKFFLLPVFHICNQYIREWLWNLDSKLTKIFEVSGQFDEKHLDFIFTVSALGWYNDCSN